MTNEEIFLSVYNLRYLLGMKNISAHLYEKRIIKKNQGCIEKTLSFPII